MNRDLEMKAYLLVRIHARETALVTGLASLLGNVGDFFRGTVGEVAGVGIAG